MLKKPDGCAGASQKQLAKMALSQLLFVREPESVLKRYEDSLYLVQCGQRVL